MKSLIVTTIARLLRALLLLASVLVLLRGHDDPGGGFVGGLLAASAFALGAVIRTRGQVRQSAGVAPHTLLGAGLLIAAASGLPAVARGAPYLSAQSLDIGLPFGLTLSLGSVLAFDVGVYLVVIGSALLIVFTLGEETR